MGEETSNEGHVSRFPCFLEFEETVPDKILLGSDYPAGQSPQEALEAVKGLSISEDFKRKIMGDNAASLLGIA